MGTWYADWCHYCKTKHGSDEALRAHIFAEHPYSIRAANYLVADKKEQADAGRADTEDGRLPDGGLRAAPAVG